jgi:SAM-dependent methyltransferase
MENTTYWRDADRDRAMQDDHGFIWRAILDAIDVDLAGTRILDAGCNRGGFLRLVAGRYDIAEGCGYDVAAAAVEDARTLAAERPLRFAVADSVPGGWGDFDVAFSHEVLYLLWDLREHAAAIYRSLRPGGVYFACTGMHSRAPHVDDWRAELSDANLPPVLDIDDVVRTFQGVGFVAAIARLRIGFMPVAGADHNHEGRAVDSLAYYNEHKLLLRFARPHAPAVG